MANSSSNSRSLVLLLLTSGLFITGLLFDYMPMIVDNRIKRTVELATNEEIQSIWSKPPIDLHSYYWLYDILNAEQFLLGEKVRVRKVGPYHFTSQVEKRIIEVSANKYRIIYNSTRYIHLNESEYVKSGSEQTLLGDLDAPLTLLNPIYASLLEGTRRKTLEMDSQTASMAISSASRLAERFNETLLINSTAREALVGRRVVFLEKVRKLGETFGFDVPIPQTNNNLIGYVALQNGSWQGPFEVYTGYQATMGSLGELISFKGKKRLTEFKGRCNRLQASVGELRPMPLASDQVLEMFHPQFCRIVHLKPTGQRKLREGIAISYVVAKEDFASADLNPDNQCFCISSPGAGGGNVNEVGNKSETGDETKANVVLNENYCSLNGAIEMAPCAHYSPIVITLSNIEPDLRIRSSIQDWEPELISSDTEQLPPSDNLSQFLILKRLGIPVHVDLTLTLFMKVTRDARFRQTISVPEVSYIPIAMVRETVSIPPKLGQVIVNLESFLALSLHLKVIMYLSAVMLLCWLAGHCYASATKDRVVPASASSQANREPLTVDNLVGPKGEASGTGADAAGKRAGNADLSDSNGRQPGGGRGGGANVADSNSSERVDSADSSRSQPPSRAGSLDPGSEDSLETRKATNESSNAHEQAETETEPGGESLISRQTVAQASSLSPPPPTQPQPPQESIKDRKPGARVFSKVDEELERRRNKAKAEQQTRATSNNSNRAQATGLATRAPTNLAAQAKRDTGGDQADGTGQLGGTKSIGKPTGERKARGAKLGNLAPIRPPNDSIQEGFVGDQTTQGKSWFMKVCLNLVRMLNGIRSSINDASQLNVADNDYQDKQLEMLAGKIDNWYSSANTDLASNTSASNFGNELEVGVGSGNGVGAGAGAEGNGGGNEDSAILSANKLEPLASGTSPSVLETEAVLERTKAPRPLATAAASSSSSPSSSSSSPAKSGAKSGQQADSEAKPTQVKQMGKLHQTSRRVPELSGRAGADFLGANSGSSVANWTPPEERVVLESAAPTAADNSTGRSRGVAATGPAAASGSKPIAAAAATATTNTATRLAESATRVETASPPPKGSQVRRADETQGEPTEAAAAAAQVESEITSTGELESGGGSNSNGALERAESAVSVAGSTQSGSHTTVINKSIDFSGDETCIVGRESPPQESQGKSVMASRTIEQQPLSPSLSRVARNESDTDLAGVEDKQTALDRMTMVLNGPNIEHLSAATTLNQSSPPPRRLTMVDSSTSFDEDTESVVGPNSFARADSGNLAAKLEPVKGLRTRGNANSFLPTNADGDQAIHSKLAREQLHNQSAKLNNQIDESSSSLPSSRAPASKLIEANKLAPAGRLPGSQVEVAQSGSSLIAGRRLDHLRSRAPLGSSGTTSSSSSSSGDGDGDGDGGVSENENENSSSTDSEPLLEDSSKPKGLPGKLLALAGSESSLVVSVGSAAELRARAAAVDSGSNGDDDDDQRVGHKSGSGSVGVKLDSRNEVNGGVNSSQPTNGLANSTRRRRRPRDETKAANNSPSKSSPPLTVIESFSKQDSGKSIADRKQQQQQQPTRRLQLQQQQQKSQLKPKAHVSGSGQTQVAPNRQQQIKRACEPINGQIRLSALANASQAQNGKATNAQTKLAPIGQTTGVGKRRTKLLNGSGENNISNGKIMSPNNSR